MPERKVLQMTQGLTNSKWKDSSSKIIFEDPILCAQFLRGYVDVPILKDVQPEDIKYPPILPIVFYDGVDKWTAATKLHDRIFFSDVLGRFIPEYQCILVQLKDYSNDELKKKKDELSIIMLIDKLRSASEFANMSEEVGKEYVNEATLETPEYLLGIMAQIVEVFLSRLNVPADEVEAFTELIKEREMGELFKHFQGYDVQEVRRQVKEEDIRILVEALRDVGNSIEVTKQQLIEKYCLEENVATEKIEMYW